MESSTVMLFAMVAMVLACAGPAKGGAAAGQPDSAGMVLVSSAFVDGESIPTKYSLYGDNVSPDLAWNRVPDDTKNFVLVCRDPDAPSGTFYHWVVLGIPDNVRSLPEGITRAAALPGGGIQGRNSFRRVGYDGPKPPSGTHRYYFDLYAVDVKPALTSAATAERVLQVIKGHIKGQASLMGTYSR
jgi:Raf kinase inhibitor-like YbhB/YbcL family protein